MWVRLPTTVSIRTTARRFTAIALLLFNFRAVTSVTESPSAGSVVTGQTVMLALDMSEAVTVSGVPTLGLNDGGTATYAAGSGSSVLTFNYTVLAGQTTPDLAVNSVNLNGGAITDGAGNAANLTGAATNPAGIVQVNGTTVPAFYVSPNGNDSWSGSLASPNSIGTDGPFKTLARAEGAMEQSSTIKTTEIEGGSYSISGWSLTSADAGETWKAYQGQTVTIDGGGSGYVDASGVNNLTIEGLTFQNLSAGPHGGGMYLSGSGETIRWNTFLNSHNNAISGADLTNSLIDSNTINGQSPGNFNGTSNAYSALMFWYGSSGNTISHNLIENAQGGGIYFASGGSEPPISNNIIDRNELVNVDTSVVDMGAIYLMDRTHKATGNQITNNVIHGYGNGSLTDQTKGIYLDDQTSNVLVSGNVLWGTAGEWGIQFHGGDHNTVQNNVLSLASGERAVLYQDDPSFGEYGMTANDFQNNIVYYAGTAPSSLWQWAQSGSSMAPPTDTTNLYYSPMGPVPNSGPVLDTNPFVANPQFQNAGSGNFSMPSTSPSYGDIGWHTLPTDQGPSPPSF